LRTIMSYLKKGYGRSAILIGSKMILTMKDLIRAMKKLSSYSEGRFGLTFTDNLGF
jgi:hypothetical protein